MLTEYRLWCTIILTKQLTRENNMNNTKDIKAHYERIMQKELENVLKQIKKEGFSEDTYTSLRLLERKIAEMNAADHFYGAWHEDNNQRFKKRA